MNKSFVLTILAIAVLFSSVSLVAQTTSKGDTLIVGPLNAAGELQGALNEAIKGDTTAAGERAHKVYKLQRGTQYILTEVIVADFPLVIVADKPDDTNRPPVIRGGLKADGGAVDVWWKLFKDATFKNLWLSGVALNGTSPIGWISQEANNKGNTYTYEGCIVEYPYTWWAVFADWGKDNDYIIKDCVFKNIGNPTGAAWNGAIFHNEGHDSTIVQNTTFFNFGAFAVHGSFYAKIDHCTFVNSVVHPINSHKMVIREFTNNLFVNVHAWSDNWNEIRRHFDSEVKGIMNYAEIQWDAQELDSLWGPGGVYGKTYDPNGDGILALEEQVFKLENNAWYYTDPIKNYWSSWANVVENPWMNNYNRAMFNSSDSTDTWTWNLKQYVWEDTLGNQYIDPDNFTGLVVVDSVLTPQIHEPFKYFTDVNTMNVNPGIVDMNGTDQLLADNCDNIRIAEAGGTVTTPVKYHNVDDYLAFTWPFDFDLSYTNATLLTAADGLPVGDLNWFPDKKAEWEQTDVSDYRRSNLSQFSLSQNYPNPFNPKTTLAFTLSQSSKVTLEVYNQIGQKVATLANNRQLNAGSHHYDFDGSELASGLYFYTIKVGDDLQQSRKMLLLK